MSLAQMAYVGRPSKAEVLAQTFLRSGGTLDGLKKVYAISASFGKPPYSHLVSLKYSMIDSPLSQPLVQQCRGIVLNSADTWDVVARPFDKWFNHGEAHAATIDWDTARVQEKLDGSLLILYHHQLPGSAGEWMWATTGTPDASAPVAGHPEGYTYSQLARWIFQQSGMKTPLPHGAWADWCFLFELLSPFNRVVTRQPDHKMVLIGVRNRLTGLELRPDEVPFDTWGWKRVEEYFLFTVEEILFTFQKMDPLVQEGYVVVDADFNRIKVKHPGYIALHHLRGNGFSSRRILDVVRAGETAEILAAFPEWKEPFEKVQHRCAAFVAAVEAEWDILKDWPFDTHEDQKAFALSATRCRLPACLFALRKGRIDSVRAFIREMHIDSLLTHLEINTSEA